MHDPRTIHGTEALRWFVDSSSAIADWRAALARVMIFREALLAVDQANPSEDLDAGRAGGTSPELETTHELGHF